MSSMLMWLVKAIQIVALVSVPIGLYVGYKNRDMNFELATVVIGAAIFYLASLALRENET